MSKKSKSTSEPSKFAKPFIQGAASQLSNTFDNNIGNIQGITDQVTGSLVPNLLDRFEQGDEGVNAARDYGTDVLSGSYLNGNPYLDDLIAQSGNDLTNQMQAALGRRGATGGSGYADIISDNLAQNSLNMRFQDYNNERGRMDSAAGRAGSIASADYLPVGGLLGSVNAAQAPLNAASQYAGGIGGLLGGYGSQTQQKSPWDMLASAAGTAAGAFAASERRVKRDITQIGSLDDGLNIYNFRYVWDADDAPLHTGVMVDEVEALRPWALGPIVDGIQTVDYSNLEAV